MKIFGFNIGKKEGVQVESYQTLEQKFNTPFQKVGDANLSLPYVDKRLKGRGFIPFGSDNLYPQLLNQLYYTSPLHGSIVDFTMNAVCGGGYKMETSSDGMSDKLEVKKFERINKLPSLVKSIIKDEEVHSRVYFLGHFKNGKLMKFKKVCPAKVRTNEYKDLYYISDDWSLQTNVKDVKPYTPECKNGEYLICFEEESLGQDVYPLPQYTSAANWIFLDGEMSYLQKSNIINSIFPAVAFMFPKKPQSEQEKQAIRDTVEGAKGAPNAGKALAFFANNKDQLPDVKTLPTGQNDKLFQQTTESIDSKISQAHQIDPILMGIRVSGKLGSGSDIKQSYIIWEKNVIKPLRAETEHIINTLLDLMKISAEFSLNDYQIINETIIEVDDDSSKTLDALNSMSPLVATKVLESMTEDEIRSLAALGSMPEGTKTKSEE
jgi:hypothetical protein